MKPFSGEDTRAEEMAEAKAVRSGKVSVAQYVAKETAEHAKEGEKTNRSELMARGKAIASGAMSPAQYASMDLMECGHGAPNEMLGVSGPGVRSMRDYKK